MDLLIDNINLFLNDDEDSLLIDHAVVVTGAEIEAVGPAARLAAQYPDHRRLDGGGRLLMPGLVNVHMHFYGTMARGISLPVAPKNFHEILQYLWWTLDKALDLDAVYHSTLLPAATAVRHGVTAVIDHHASPNAVGGSLDRIEEALAQVGLRGLLCYEVSDRDGPDSRDAGLRENERYIQRCRQAQAADPAHLFDGMMGLHASFTVDDDTLARAAGIARDLARGCHIHVLEDGVDQTETRRLYGRGVVDRLHRFGVLGEQSIAAHAIHTSKRDRELLADTDTIVTHQAQSNMNNAVGRADIFDLLERGVTVGLGTDGMTPDIKAEARAAFLLHKHHLADPNIGWNELATMLLKNNPAIYRRLTGQPVGVIAPGYLADMILVDYQPPTPLTGANFWGHFLFGLVDSAVHTSIINGRIVLEKGQLPNFDAAAAAAAARASTQGVWERFAA